MSLGCRACGGRGWRWEERPRSPPAPPPRGSSFPLPLSRTPAASPGALASSSPGRPCPLRPRPQPARTLSPLGEAVRGVPSAGVSGRPPGFAPPARGPVGRAVLGPGAPFRRLLAARHSALSSWSGGGGRRGPLHRPRSPMARPGPPWERMSRLEGPRRTSSASLLSLSRRFSFSFSFFSPFCFGCGFPFL